MYSGIYILLYLPIGACVQLVYLSLLEAMLQPRYTRKIWKYAYSLAYSLLVALFTSRLSPMPRFAVNSAVLIVTPLALFRGRISVKIMTYAFWMVVYPCCEALAMLAAPLWGWQFDSASPANQLLFDLVCMMISWAFYVAAHSVLRVLDDRPERALLVRLMLSALSMALCAFLFVFNSMHWAGNTVHPLITKHLNVLNAAGVFLPFFALREIIVLVHRLNSSMQEAEQYRLMEARAMTELRQTQSLAAKNEIFRTMRHDLQNHLLAMDALAQKDENERLRAYIADLRRTAQVSSVRAYCGHPVIDGLFESKALRMQESGIEARWQTMPAPAQFGLTDLELCCIIGNALDNAIESCERMPEGEKRSVSVSLDISGRGFFFRVVNSCKDAPAVLKTMRTKSRKRSAGAGIGLNSMQRVVDAHGGEMLHSANAPDSITLSIYIPA